MSEQQCPKCGHVRYENDLFDGACDECCTWMTEQLAQKDEQLVQRTGQRDKALGNIVGLRTKLAAKQAVIDEAADALRLATSVDADEDQQADGWFRLCVALLADEKGGE